MPAIKTDLLILNTSAVEGFENKNPIDGWIPHLSIQVSIFKWEVTTFTKLSSHICLVNFSKS